MKVKDAQIQTIKNLYESANKKVEILFIDADTTHSAGLTLRYWQGRLDALRGINEILYQRFGRIE